MFEKVFKAMSIGMTVLAAVSEALSPQSDEGANISQREYVRISLRSGLAACKAFGAEIVNEPGVDLIKMIKEELEYIDLASGVPGS